MTTLPFLLLASAFVSAGDPPPPEIVWRVYDLGAATPVSHAGRTDAILLPYLLPPWRRDEPGRWEVQDPRDDMVSILQQAHGSEFEYEGRFINVDEHGRMFVAAPAAVHQSIERILAFLESVFGRSVELRVDVLELAADLPVQPSTLSIEAADKLLASAAGASRRTLVLQLAPGRIALQHLAQELEAVADFDVEIAQQALAYDPISTSFSIGTRLAVRAASAPGGVRLACLWQDAESPRGLEMLELRSGGLVSGESGFRDVDGPKGVQGVSVLHRSLAFSTFVPRGQALVLSSSLDVESGQSRQVVVLRVQGTPPDPLASLVVREDGTRIEVLDASYLCPPSVSIESDLLTRETTRRDLQQLLSMGTLYAVIDESDFSPVEQQLFDDPLRDVYQLGPWFVLLPSYEAQDNPQPGAPPFLTPDASLFQLASEPRLVNVGLTLRRVGAEPRVLARWSLPIVAGEECAAVLGGERLFVGDNDVEVAQGASIADPEVSDAFDGLAVRIRPMRARDGGLTLDLSVLAHVLRGPLRRVETGFPEAGGMEQGSYDDLFLSERLRFAADAASRKVVLGESSAASGRTALALEVELR